LLKALAANYTILIAEGREESRTHPRAGLPRDLQRRRRQEVER
jgi:hypothetical protein